GVRVDSSPQDAAVPSARVGIRYGLDTSGKTVLRSGIGRFVGTVPLAAAAFDEYPARTDQFFSADSGEVARELVFKPSRGELHLPRARAVVVGLERALADRLDGQIVFTDRQSSRLTTLDVPVDGGPLRVDSTGSGRYRELQLSVRRTWT